MAKKTNIGNDFKAIMKNVINDIDTAMGESFEIVVNNAKADAPDDHEGNSIGATISLTRTAKLKYRIKVGNKFAAYYEFGTGNAAKDYVPALPEEWQEIAKQFIRNRKGRIKLNKYLYPAYNNELPRLFEKIQKIIQNA